MGSLAPVPVGGRPVQTPREGDGHPSPERLAWLVLIPALSTAVYYGLTPSLQRSVVVQMLPQLLGYLALAAWGAGNRSMISRLGLAFDRSFRGLSWGIPVGVALGVLNAWVILYVVPGLGADIEFLKDTPHARVPALLMVPWAIVAIAFFVEVNFRGFQLGRWQVLLDRTPLPRVGRAAPLAAVLVSTCVFALDPFLVGTFRHLHWIAVWDGIVWGCLWLKLRTLYASISAHAVEVIVMYLAVRAAFT